jgi:hypothetical protein
MLTNCKRSSAHSPTSQPCFQLTQTMSATGFTPGTSILSPYLIGLAVTTIIGTLLGPYSSKQFNALPLMNDIDLLLHVDIKHHKLLDSLTKRVNTAFKVLRMKEDSYADLNSHITVWNAIIQQLQYSSLTLLRNYNIVASASLGSPLASCSTFITTLSNRLPNITSYT